MMVPMESTVPVRWADLFKDLTGKVSRVEGSGDDYFGLTRIWFRTETWVGQRRGLTRTSTISFWNTLSGPSLLLLTMNSWPWEVSHSVMPSCRCEMLRPTFEKECREWHSERTLFSVVPSRRDSSSAAFPPS